MTITKKYIWLLIATLIAAGVAILVISLTGSETEEPINTERIELPDESVLGVTEEIVFSDCGEGIQCLYDAFAANCSEANVELSRPNSSDGYTIRRANITNTDGCVVEVSLENDRTGNTLSMQCAGMAIPNPEGLPLLLCEQEDGETIELFTL